jgi:D-alanine-D-alanine ligase
MDKVLSKKLFEHHNVPTAVWTDDTDDAERIGYPLVVKPSREGSTVGISLVKRSEDLAAALSLAWTHKGTPMLERYVPGREASVAILEDRVLGTVEIRPKKEFYDYEAKYQRNDTEYLVPAPFAGDVDQEVRAAALRAHNALGCEGYSRVDVRVTDEGKPFVLEVNTLPGMTNTSLIPKIARHAGMDYSALVVRILRTAKLRA